MVGDLDDVRVDGLLGLPLLAGFVAELMMFLALWHFISAEGWSVLWMVGPAFVLAITAAYYLWSMQRTIFEGGDETQPQRASRAKPCLTLVMLRNSPWSSWPPSPSSSVSCRGLRWT